MASRYITLTLGAGIFALLCVPAFAGPIVTIDFETEDDFVTPLGHGQIVDPAFDVGPAENGNIFNLSSTQDGSDGHLGVTVFDSDLSGTLDPDLEVGTGNILILQNDDNPATTGDFYDDPNDERSLNDNGSIVFDFLYAVGPMSLSIIDANGGFGATLTLRDTSTKTRTFTIPADWTYDIDLNPTKDGYAPLDLTILTPQTGERTATTSAVEDPGFDITSVDKLTFSFIGAPLGTTSGGIDTLILQIPEPATAALLALGAAAALPILRRRAAKVA